MRWPWSSPGRPRIEGGPIDLDGPASVPFDPSYVQIAEATVGAVLLFQPSELAGVATEMSASKPPDEMVSRAGADLARGFRFHRVQNRLYDGGR